MATLEKIRNKSVLLFVIIIVALLAFILGDFLTSGRTYFGHPTTVAKAGNATVEYQDYQERLNQLSEQYRSQGREVSSDVLSQNVLQQLITEQLFKEQYDKLGIVVTDKELTEALTGNNPHPAAAQMIAYLAQQLQLPEASGKAVFDAMQNPAKYGLNPQVGEQLRQVWANQEKELEAQMLNQKYMRLISGLFTANKLDAKSFYDDNATTRHISYVSQDVAAIPDEDVDVNEKEIKKTWNENKGQYELDEETREINYIYVAIEPSQADRVAGQKAVDEAIIALNAKPGTEGVASNSAFVVNTFSAPASAFNDQALKDFAATAQTGEAKLINRDGETYHIAKVLGSKTGIDSINVSILRAAPGTKLDSVVNVLNGGKTFASLSDGATMQGQDSIWTALEGPGVDEKIKNVLTNAPIGRAFVHTDTVNGQTASAIYKVNIRKNPVRFYEIAAVDYTVDPSQETLAKLNSDLKTYVSNNSSAKDFAEKATEAGYTVLTDLVSASSVGIGNAQDSRRFVKWAMDNGKGKVSPVFQNDKQTYFIAIAVKDIYEDYLPATASNIAPQLEAQTRNRLKAEKLMAKYEGKAKDLNGYAKLMGTAVAQGDVNITSPILLNLGVNESALQGAIAAADKGKVVGPVKGNRSILVFTVDGIDTDNRPFNVEEYGARFNQTFGLVRRQTVLPLLLGKDKIDNRSLNFVQAPGE